MIGYVVLRTLDGDIYIDKHVNQVECKKCVGFWWCFWMVLLYIFGYIYNILHVMMRVLLALCNGEHNQRVDNFSDLCVYILCNLIRLPNNLIHICKVIWNPRRNPYIFCKQ